MTIFYVNKSGNDSNTGLSEALAKLTIQAAITTAGAGTHTIIVQTGVYHEALVVSGAGSISFLSDGQVVLDGRGVLLIGAHVSQTANTWIFDRNTNKGGWRVRGYTQAGFRVFNINSTPIIFVRNAVVEECAVGYQGTVSGATAFAGEITNTLFMDCGAGVSLNAPNNFTITNCTFVRCPTGLSIATTGAGNSVRNCIFARAGIPAMQMLAYSGTGAVNINSNFNNLYFDGVSTAGYSGTHTTLAAWQAAVGGGRDVSSISADPLFIDPAKDLFGITTNSPSFNAGGGAGNGVPKGQGSSGIGSSAQHEILGISSVANSSLWTNGVFVNTQINGSGRIELANPGTPVGTFATDVKDFGFNRRIRWISMKGVFNYPESVIDFDNNDTQPNRAKIEVRHSLTAFLKTDVSPAWVTVEDGDDIMAVLGVSQIRYLQIRFTLRVDGVAA